MGDWHVCEGTIDIQGIYWDCTETYTVIKMTSFKGSPWSFNQDNDRCHSACATIALFRRHREDVIDCLAISPDLSPIENVQPIMKRRIRQG